MKLLLVYGRFITANIYVVVKEEMSNYTICPFMKDIFNPKNYSRIVKFENKHFKVEEIKTPPKYDFIRDFNLKEDWNRQWVEHRYRECLVNLIFHGKDELLYRQYSKLIDFKYE